MTTITVNAIIFFIPILLSEKKIVFVRELSTYSATQHHSTEPAKNQGHSAFSLQLAKIGEDNFGRHFRGKIIGFRGYLR